MTPAIAHPPLYSPPTASAARVMKAPAFLPAVVAGDANDLVEEPMDYSPIASGRVMSPDLIDEAWADDDSGPMGF
jgi:hypothetical protein